MTRRLDPDDLFGGPPVAVLRSWRPDTVTAWKEAANGLLTNQCCAFHRNMEISLRYAWLYRSLPTCLKWAGMAVVPENGWAEVKKMAHHVVASNDADGVAEAFMKFVLR